MKQILGVDVGKHHININFSIYFNSIQYFCLFLIHSVCDLRNCKHLSTSLWDIRAFILVRLATTFLLIFLPTLVVKFYTPNNLM